MTCIDPADRLRITTPAIESDHAQRRLTEVEEPLVRSSHATPQRSWEAGWLCAATLASFALYVSEESSYPGHRRGDRDLHHSMPRAKWYSPQLRRDLVTRLYFRARAEGIPMTRLADRLIAEALASSTVVHGEFTARVAEEPTAPVPG